MNFGSNRDDDHFHLKNSGSMIIDDEEFELESVSPLLDVGKQWEKEMERAYHLGLLHGINAQSMAQVENDVMQFDDHGWDL